MEGSDKNTGGLVEERRKFTVAGSEDLFIAIPSADDIRQSDWSYSKAYNKALVEGITTSSEMMEILKKRNIVGPAYEKVGEDLKSKVGEKIVAMELETDKEKRRDLAIEVARLREDLFQWNQRVNGPMSNTCEQIAEDSRLDYLTSCIVQKTDGSRVWPDYRTYLDESNRAMAFQARLEVMLFLQGLDPDFLEKTPENMVLKQIAAEELEEHTKALEEEAEMDRLESLAESDKAAGKVRRKKAVSKKS